jgi:hypothetical protein
MNEQLTVDEAITEMASHAETIDASGLQTVPESVSIGDNIRQGDIFLICIETMPSGTPVQDRQLAPGTTQGSRHVLSGDCEIVKRSGSFTAPGESDPVHEALVGPAFQCRKGCTVEHPEHGNWALPNGSVWQVTFQQAYADEVRRIQD